MYTSTAKSNPVGVWWGSSCPFLLWERVSPSADTGWGVLGNYLHERSDFFSLRFQIDEGIREDSVSRLSCAWMGLHPKQSKACTQAKSMVCVCVYGVGGVHSNEGVWGQQCYYGSTAGFLLHLWSDMSQVHVLNRQTYTDVINSRYWCNTSASFKVWDSNNNKRGGGKRKQVFLLLLRLWDNSTENLFSEACGTVFNTESATVYTAILPL